MFEKDVNGLPVKLNIRKLRQLLDCCLLNARRLLEGAEFLFGQKLYSVSLLLSVLAIEELGKREMLPQHIWVIDNDKECEEFWQSFRRHKDKLYWAVKRFVEIDADLKQRKKVDWPSILREQHEELKSFAFNIDQLKQLATYVDIIETEVVNPRKLYKRHALPMLKLSKQLLDYHIKMQPTNKIIDYYKNTKKKRRKGETLAEFIGRLYLSEKAGSGERLSTTKENG
jgi:AbiV family abortive infection protein